MESQSHQFLEIAEKILSNCNYEGAASYIKKVAAKDLLMAVNVTIFFIKISLQKAELSEENLSLLKSTLNHLKHFRNDEIDKRRRNTVNVMLDIFKDYLPSGYTRSSSMAPIRTDSKPRD